MSMRETPWALSKRLLPGWPRAPTPLASHSNFQLLRVLILDAIVGQRGCGVFPRPYTVT